MLVNESDLPLKNNLRDFRETESDPTGLKALLFRKFALLRVV